MPTKRLRRVICLTFNIVQRVSHFWEHISEFVKYLINLSLSNIFIFAPRPKKMKYVCLFQRNQYESKTETNILLYLSYLFNASSFCQRHLLFFNRSQLYISCRLNGCTFRYFPQNSYRRQSKMVNFQLISHRVPMKYFRY